MTRRTRWIWRAEMTRMNRLACRSLARKGILAVCALCALVGTLSACGVGGGDVAGGSTIALPEPSSTVASPESAEPVAGLEPSSIPAYDGAAYVEVDGGVPSFSEADFSAPAEAYAPLDSLGRCGAAMAVVSRDTMPTGERGSIGMVKPSGWHTVRYDDLISDRYLYNRCHLIGYQLTGENANERNLITGTRHMNVEGMLPFENEVADYVEATGNRVLYRVTPVFVGEELVARGVQIEALSVEDGGEGVSFNVFCHNVQPGIEIDYETGESRRSQTAVDAGGSDSDVHSEGTAYILNIDSGKFHLPGCPSVARLAERNGLDTVSTFEEMVCAGHSPCAICLG